MFSNSIVKILASPFVNILQNLPWSDMLEKAGLYTWGRLATRGMYEVLEYESTLELLDMYGKQAVFHKRQRVRYLQDNIIAYQDQAWGDGRILLDYRCAPGFPVDRYQLGHKTLILISLREVKQRGDIDEFNIQWGIRNGFLKSQESWETEISHRMKQLRIRVIFPTDRPPLRRVCVEASRQIVHPITGEYQRQLPDGRSQVIFEIDNPRLNERYILNWDW
jgi:hypothetical protein